MKLTDKPEWQALYCHYQNNHQVKMRDLFEDDEDRFNNFSLSLGNILFDYSKNRIDKKTSQLLTQLASSCGLKEQIDAMFRGDKINNTENRSVLHTALRHKSNQNLIIDGENISLEIKNEMQRLEPICKEINSGKWLGYDNSAIKDVVNIGIGGSHLGPQMVTEALKPYQTKTVRFHFISNVDETEINDLLKTLKQETTLFIICSKTFTTQETMLNAITAKNWLLKSINNTDMLSRHFIGVTTNTKAALDFGISAEYLFKMWDWVGGRYSMWSAIGVSIMIAIGVENFKLFLAGANQVDHHFKTEPFDKNIPVIMAMLGVWYHNFFEAEATAVLPFSQYLSKFPAYLQQVDMESNGKSVNRNGHSIDYSTGPVLFGELGNPGQHTFFQLLHQSNRLIPIDVLTPLSNVNDESDHLDEMLSNVFAQTEALMRGKTLQEVNLELKNADYTTEQIEKLAPHKVFSGNRPSNTFLFDKLDPKTVGSLAALYEHKIFVQGVIWNINSFDQWGVELGKQLAVNILGELKNPDELLPISKHDNSTLSLIQYYLNKKKKNE